MKKKDLTCDHTTERRHWFVILRCIVVKLSIREKQKKKVILEESQWSALNLT
jgi:hypothetical protein